MEFFQIILWALALALAAADDSCPAPSELSPCTCDGEGLNCMGARTLEEVRRAFRAKFKYGGVRSVWVQGTPITNIPGDLFGNVRSQQYYVEVNNLTSLDFNAFSASKDTLRLLSLFGNKLDTLDYSGLTQYSRLELLNLGRNQISTIPDSAFNSKTLNTLILAQNKISHIGMNAFANLPGLSKLELSMNQLTTLGPLSIATKQHSSNFLSVARVLDCMGARTLKEVRRAFRAKFKYGGVRSVWVQGTPITNIPGDLFGNVRSQQYYVEVNNLTSLDFNAFSASKDTLRLLSLFGNKLDTLDYSGLTQYSRLELLNLGRNQISTIPDSAFNSKTLNTLILAQNKISHIGMNAFANLPGLSKLELSMNQLTTLGPLSIATKQHSSNFLINFAANRISSVSSTAFEGASPYAIYMSQNKLTSLPKDSFSNLITRIAQKGGFIEVSSNPFTCSGCDYSWLVLNKDIVHSKFVGFTCTDGRSMQDLTKSNIQCN